MSKDYTSIDQVNKHFFPKSYEKERLEKMTVEEHSKYWVSKMMKKVRRILKEEK